MEEREDNNGERGEVRDGNRGYCNSKGVIVFVTVSLSSSLPSSLSSSLLIIIGQLSKSPGWPSLIQCECTEYS